MRTLTAGLQSEVAADKIEPIYLLHGAFLSGDVRLWTGYGDLVWDGETFTGAGTLISLAPINQGVDGEVTGVQVTLSGVDPDTLSLAMDEHYQSRALKIWFGAFADGALVDDPLLLFDGLMDVMPIDDDPERPTVSMTGESRLLGAVRGRILRYSNADQDALFPGDKGFEFVEQLQQQNFTWGR